eukprot:gene23714-biopygen18236
MSVDPSLPEDIVADVLLRALRLGAPLSGLSVVCRSWRSIVAQNLAEMLVGSHMGKLSKVLWRALQHDHCSLACELASRPQSVEDSNLALLLAVVCGRADLVKILLDAPKHAARADNESLEGLLEDAAYRGLQRVLHRGHYANFAGRIMCKFKGGGGHALLLAAAGGHTDTVNLLLHAREHAAHAEGEALLEAAENGHIEIVRMLLNAPQHAAHADCEERQALVLAAGNGHTDVARMLLNAPEHAAHADSQRGQALLEAAEIGHIEIVRMLLNAPQHTAHADCREGQALLEAAENGHIEIVHMLLNAPQHAAQADCEKDRLLW